MKGDVAPKVCYPFGFRGKKYSGQKTEIISCITCKKTFEVKILDSIDPDFPGMCHASNPSICPHCGQKMWYRDGFEKC